MYKNLSYRFISVETLIEYFNASDEEFSQLNPKCDTDTVLCMYVQYIQDCAAAKRYDM